MAFAALEAMEELDLFGIHGGGPSSKIHVMLDEAQKVSLRNKMFIKKYNFNRTMTVIDKNVLYKQLSLLFCSVGLFCNQCYQGNLSQR